MDKVCRVCVRLTAFYFGLVYAFFMGDDRVDGEI